MKKFNRLIGTAAALLLTVTACSNSFTPQASGQQQSQNGGGSYSQEALATPLTLEACDAGAVVTFSNKAAGPVTYKVNRGAAQTIAKNSTGTITLAKSGDKVEFFGDNKAYATSASNYSNIACDKDCNVYGNIMSLVKSQGFEKATTLENAYTFARLFADNTHVKNKSGADLLLPATTLANYCYQEMFDGCASLTAAPDLPATTLAENCYSGMFYNCASLTAAPNLPATTLANYCYKGMFHSCTSLTTAPSLPATTLAENCYSDMFQGCASLTAAPELKATTLANYCYQYMFYGCASLNSVTCLATDISAIVCTTDWLNGVAASGTFTKAAGMTSWTRGENGIPYGWTYNEEAPLAIPLTLEAAVDGAVVTFTNKASGPVTYKVNGGTAQKIASGDSANITLAKVGGKVEFFGDNKAYATSESNCSNIYCDKDCYVYGNIMSLVNSAHFENATALEEGYTFASFFRSNTHIKNKSDADLLLPATTLADFCYYGMFSGCTSLTATPSLPATTLADFCYYGMFSGCTSLTATPSLPATTLANYCYHSMFSGCTSLKTAPSLPATTLAESCYGSMFYGCTSLTAAPSLPAATLVASCYGNMFRDCTSLKAAPSLPAATLANYCYNGMFSGCTSLTAAPSLPAAMLAEGCYSGMFFGCASLTAAPSLPAATLVASCYGSMFYGCTSLTAAPSLPATTLANFCYQGMFSGCTSLASVTCLATDISASNCTDSWLKNVAASGTFTKADGMTGWTTDSASGIPSGWTVEDYSMKVPLTLEAAVAGAVVTFSNKADRPVTYKVNGGEVQKIASGDFANITLANIGDKVEFFGDNNKYAKDLFDNNYSNIACSADCYVYGNIMSLVKSEGFENATTLENAYTFARLFAYNTHIKNKSGAHLLLPATTLADSCYSWMFYGCASLTAAPSLPATTLTKACYEHMFDGCASLTAAPSLPATTLAQSCYSDMFSGCTSLTAAPPSLPATTLAMGCYSGMFRGCASLTAAPSLPATTLTEFCYPYMFQGCASLTAAPDLPATTLVIVCYSFMFQGCTSLASVTCLATDISTSGCTEDWLDGVADSGTFTKAKDVDWSGKTGASGIPNGWQVVEQ